MANEPRHPVSRQSDETSLLTSPVLWIAVAIVLSLGVGLDVWPEDYEICGTEWKMRGPRCAEMMRKGRSL